MIAGVAALLVLLATLSTYADDVAPPGLIVEHPEAKLLKLYPGIARRNGDRLDIQLGNGRDLVFKNPCPDNDSDKECHDYTLANYDPGADIIVVKSQYYEWHTATAIDRRSGAQIGLDEAPHIAPGGRYLAVVKSDAENSFFIVQIIRRQGGAFKIEADNLNPDSENCAFEAWQADESFSIVCQVGMDQYQEKLVSSGPGGKWSVSLTGRVLSEKDFELLDAQSYESE
jgi:hypothetical protein